MSALRPLPPRPSLEFEHKAAKGLLRQLRDQDPDALARAGAQHPGFKAPPKLADAQLVIAREYGFTSWPRLVRYFEDLERQRLSPYAQRLTPDAYHANVRSLLAGHLAQRPMAARAFAAFVPRFYGMRAGDTYALAPTEGEARLAVARQAGFSNWEDLVASTTPGSETEVPAPGEDPFPTAVNAMKALDLNALTQVVASHPELLRPTPYLAAKGRNLMSAAIIWERKHGPDAMRPTMEWLAAQGLDRRRELSAQLCGRMPYMKAEAVRALLDQGADPNWVAPNGIPVLEHALVRYWNGAAVDALAEYATPRKALWIAAGLGDVDGVRRFLDAAGHPTPAARRLRPPLDFVGFGKVLSNPEPDHEEILMEAFFVAVLNGRTAVLEYMVSRGAPIDTLLWGTPIINVAVGNAWTPTVECLVRCGANLDLRGYHPDVTAREAARMRLEQFPNDTNRQRIADLCGVDLKRTPIAHG